MLPNLNLAFATNIYINSPYYIEVLPQMKSNTNVGMCK